MKKSLENADQISDGCCVLSQKTRGIKGLEAQDMLLSQSTEDLVATFDQERPFSGWNWVKFGVMGHPISPVKKINWLGWRLLSTLFLVISGDLLARL